MTADWPGSPIQQNILELRQPQVMTVMSIVYMANPTPKHKRHETDAPKTTTTTALANKVETTSTSSSGDSKASILVEPDC
jgi:hypothetical protein